MAKRTKREKIVPGDIRPEDVQNADLPLIYSNNFQLRGGETDIWLCFNAVNPVGNLLPTGKFPTERKASIVVSVQQFFAITNMMNEQARVLQIQMARASEEKPSLEPPSK